MKNARVKAKEFCDRMPLSVASHRASIEGAVYILLKEQDRDTRHACAEAVIQLPGCHSSNENAIYDYRGEICEAVDVNAAHDACMNAKAI